MLIENNMSLKEFLIEWKSYGFKTALNNWLIYFTKWFVGAERIDIIYKERLDNK